MKKISYVCDRCGETVALIPRTNKIGVPAKARPKRFRIAAFRGWLHPDPYTTTYDELDICEKCRHSFDEWLESGKHV